MLLLVLILVLVAFGLLVVALLTGNVLCAWLSVAVSVAAAVVLVVDWLQRRSALKAGAAAAPPASMSAEAIPLGDPDPATEVLPVVPPLAEAGGTQTLSAAAQSTEDETRYDRPLDGQQTVIMPAVQPSGSSARPSGAEGPTTASGGSSSPSVTEKAHEPAAVGDIRSAPDSRRGDAEATVAVDIRKAGIGGRKPGASAGGAPGESAETSTGTGGSTSSPSAESAAVPASDAEPSGIGSAAAGGAAAVAAASAASAASTPPTRSADEAVDSPVADGSDAEGLTSATGAASASSSDVADDRTEAPTVDTVKSADLLGGRAGDSRVPESRTSESRTSDGRTSTDAAASADGAGGFADSKQTVSTPSVDTATSAPGAAAESTADESTADERTADESTADESAAGKATPVGASADQTTRATFGGPASSGHELFDPVDRSAAAAASAPPPPPPGAVEDTAVMSAAGSTRHVDESEPPEEPLDHAAARIVAGLDDEVLVIDEQPRYHVATCRAVGTQATIPLPAREAIELGFTPCGWCTPDAVLADRHRASARP